MGCAGSDLLARYAAAGISLLGQRRLPGDLPGTKRRLRCACRRLPLCFTPYSFGKAKAERAADAAWRRRCGNAGDHHGGRGFPNGADPAILRLRLCRHFDEKREDHQPEHRSDSHGARAVVLCGFLCARAL